MSEYVSYKLSMARQMTRHRPLGERITAAMDARCVSAFGLASRAGVSERDVKRARWGDPTLADAVYVEVAKALGVEVKL